MVKIKIWKSTDKITGQYFYCLEGKGSKCVVFELDMDPWVDNDFQGFGFYRSYAQSSFKTDVVVNAETEAIKYLAEFKHFCMLHGLSEEVIPMLKFTFKNQKEVFCED